MFALSSSTDRWLTKLVNSPFGVRTPLVFSLFRYIARTFPKGPKGIPSGDGFAKGRGNEQFNHPHSGGVMNRRELLQTSAVIATGFLAGCQTLAPMVTSRRTTAARLLFNENPYGPSPTARKAMSIGFDEGNLYTELPSEGLRALIAEQVGLTPDHIVIGAGSGEVLNVAGLVFGKDGGDIIAANPTFEQLTDYARNIGATIQQVPLDASMKHDLTEMSRRISNKTTLVYICNPNNPTGTIVSSDALRSFCEDTSKRKLVFVDEAYHEYVEDPQYRSMIDLVRLGQNIIVSRTASKIHGLAGLRIGFGIGQPETVRKLRKCMTGSVNVVGLRGAIASYRDNEFQDFCRGKNREGKQFLYRMFEERKLQYTPSEANFVFFRTGKSIENFRPAMREQGVLVGRPFPPYSDWCRVSIGTTEELQQFAKALPAALAT